MFLFFFFFATLCIIRLSNKSTCKRDCGLNTNYRYVLVIIQLRQTPHDVGCDSRKGFFSLERRESGEIWVEMKRELGESSDIIVEWTQKLTNVNCKQIWMVTFSFGIGLTFLFARCCLKTFRGGFFTMSLAIVPAMGKLSEHIIYETANAISNVKLQQLALRFC